MQVLIYMYNEDYAGSYIEFVADSAGAALAKLASRVEENYKYSIARINENMDKFHCPNDAYYDQQKIQCEATYNKFTEYLGSRVWDNCNITDFKFYDGYEFIWYDVEQ